MGQPWRCHAVLPGYPKGLAGARGAAGAAALARPAVTRPSRYSHGPAGSRAPLGHGRGDDEAYTPRTHISQLRQV